MAYLRPERDPSHTTFVDSQGWPASAPGMPHSLGRSVSFLLLGLLAIPLAGCSRKPEQPPQQSPEAGFVVLRAETVSLTTELAGRTAPFLSAEVRPQVAGIVKARLFTEGALVRAGQPLYQIDSSLYRAAADQARANLASAQAAQTAAAALVGRYRPLLGVEAISKQEYTNAVAAAAQAGAGVAQSRAALRTASINLGFTQVTAPIGGRIGRSSVTAGALVTASQAEPLAVIQRLDPIYVDIQQSVADLLALRRAMAAGGVMPASAEVALTLDDGSAYPLRGRLEFAEVTVEPATGSVTLRARVPNPDGLLLPGMYVRATIAQGRRPDAILAPQAGVSRTPKGDATAMVVGAGGKVELRTLRLGETIGSKWLVLGGLAPGDRLIVEGVSKIKPGQRVRPVPAGSRRGTPAGAPPRGS